MDVANATAGCKTDKINACFGNHFVQPSQVTNEEIRRLRWSKKWRWWQLLYEPRTPHSLPTFQEGEEKEKEEGGERGKQEKRREKKKDRHQWFS